MRAISPHYTATDQLAENVSGQEAQKDIFEEAPSNNSSKSSLPQATPNSQKFQHASAWDTTGANKAVTSLVLLQTWEWRASGKVLQPISTHAWAHGFLKGTEAESKAKPTWRHPSSNASKA